VNSLSPWLLSGATSRLCGGDDDPGVPVWFLIAFWTILALQLDVRYQLGVETAGLFGVVGVVGILFAPVAGRIADRKGPHVVIGLGSLIIAASWAIFGTWGAVAGLIVGVVLLDFR
jgi:MFS family permease